MSDAHHHRTGTVIAMRLPILVLLSVAVTAALAQQAPVQTPAPAAVDEVESALGTIEEVTVSGEQPGPGLWKISKDGHVLWVLGTLQPLPKKMSWRSQSVEAIIAESQALLVAPRVDAGIGFFKGMTLLPSMLGARRNPDGAKLQEVLPPDLYARWLPLKARYIGRDAGIERWRPIFAAGELYERAIAKSGLTTQSDVLPIVKRIAKQYKVDLIEPTLEIEIDKPGQAIKQFKKSSLQDIECFAKTLDRLETDLDAIRARATAWAVGDIDTLRGLPYPDQFGACGSAILSSPIVQDRGLQDVLQRVESLWLEEAEAALARNEITFAVLPMSQLLRADGYVAKLQARGYDVEAP
jgi:TraB/PrgY/gumN family